MGYPMTWRRVVNRNGLQDGDYGTPPQKATFVSTADEFRQAFSLLAGDLRRLERDAVDEHGTCRGIARRTGVAEDVVAAVLKEFMDW